MSIKSYPAVVAFLVIFLTASSVLAQTTAPTLRIVTENPNLPSDLYYGDIKVKPLRLRPGTNQVISIHTDNDFFVMQHYIDFLDRMPDPAGFAGWLDVLEKCNNRGLLGSNNTGCDRVHVSAGFYGSPEFSTRGSLVYRLYATSLGRKPLRAEWYPDMQRISGFQTAEQEEANKQALINDFVNRAEFKSVYDGLSNSAYVDRLIEKARIGSLATRNQMIADLDGGRTRAEVLRKVAESPEVFNKYYNEIFVVMQYFGYLRRDPDPNYLEWIRILDADRDYRKMIFNFVYSPEYLNGRF